MYVCMSVCLHACMYVFMHVCMHVCTYVRTYMYVWMYVCIHVSNHCLPTSNRNMECWHCQVKWKKHINIIYHKYIYIPYIVYPIWTFALQTQKLSWVFSAIKRLHPRYPFATFNAWVKPVTLDASNKSQDVGWCRLFFLPFPYHPCKRYLPTVGWSLW